MSLSQGGAGSPSTWRAEITHWWASLGLGSERPDRLLACKTVTRTLQPPYAGGAVNPTAVSLIDTSPVGDSGAVPAMFSA